LQDQVSNFAERLSHARWSRASVAAKRGADPRRTGFSTCASASAPCSGT